MEKGVGSPARGGVIVGAYRYGGESPRDAVKCASLFHLSQPIILDPQDGFVHKSAQYGIALFTTQDLLPDIGLAFQTNISQKRHVHALR
jgi:hypothetical protein